MCRALVRSPFGAVLRGIRENEAKTMALGYNTRLYKIAVVAIAYALGGLAGALYAPFAGFANTELLFWLLSGQVLIMVIVGGAGTLIGPILGAAFFMLMEHQLSAWTEAWALYFGLIFIGFVLFAPEGIWGLATRPGPARRPRVMIDGAARARRRDAALRRPGGRRPRRHARGGGRGARRHRSQRRRQDHAVQPDHRRGEAERGQRPLRRRPITGLPAHEICLAGCRAPFSSPRCFPSMSARENVRLAAQARHPRRWQPFGGAPDLRARRRTRADAALGQLGLTGIADRTAGLLSHGDQRLLEVAMAMAQQPRVLLLDEPTQGLSVEETAQAVETLARFLKTSRMTVLLVEHDMEVVFRLADRITVLHRGAVIAEGTPERSRPTARCRTPTSGGSSDAADRGPQHALRREPRPAGRRPRHAAGPHQRRARPQRRRQDHHGQDHHGAGCPEPGACCSATPRSPAGSRTGWRGPASPTCRRAG